MWYGLFYKVWLFLVMILVLLNKDGVNIFMVFLFLKNLILKSMMKNINMKKMGNFDVENFLVNL